MAASRGHGGTCPPVGSSSLHLPPTPCQKKKNGPNQPFFDNFFGFLPPQNRILPPRCPHKIFLVLPLLSGQLTELIYFQRLVCARNDPSELPLREMIFPRKGEKKLREITRQNFTLSWVKSILWKSRRSVFDDYVLVMQTFCCKKWSLDGKLSGIMGFF